MKCRLVVPLILAIALCAQLTFASEGATAKSVRYNGRSKELTVSFHDNTYLKYSNVPASVAEEIEQAESIDEAYNRLIKGKFTEIKPVSE